MADLIGLCVLGLCVAVIRWAYRRDQANPSTDAWDQANGG